MVSLKNLFLLLKRIPMRPFYRYTAVFFKYAFIAWLVIILTVSSIPNLNTPHLRLGRSVLRLDYLFHTTQYTILALLFILWKGRNGYRFSTGMIFLTLLAGILLAVLDETHQLFIPGRSFNPIDMVSNGMGVILGLGIGITYLNVKHKNGTPASSDRIE